MRCNENANVNCKVTARVGIDWISGIHFSVLESSLFSCFILSFHIVLVIIIIANVTIDKYPNEHKCHLDWFKLISPSDFYDLWLIGVYWWVCFVLFVVWFRWSKTIYLQRILASNSLLPLAHAAWHSVTGRSLAVGTAHWNDFSFDTLRNY